MRTRVQIPASNVPHTCGHSADEAEMRIFGPFWPKWRASGSVKESVSEKKWRAIEEDTDVELLPPHTFT